jgi:hypothetical protein
MKTFLIFSDTHGRRAGIERLAPLFEENDYIIHLGDGAADMREVAERYPDKTYVCQGNNDFYPALSDWVIEEEGVRIFLCHGHKYRVKSGLERLAEEAERRDCTVALYGHTHTASVSELSGVTLINPGSLRFPAGEGGSYCYLVVDKGKVYPTIVGESVF